MMNIDLSLKQETNLSPQMQQFFGILQANNQELGQLISQEISVNPVLEYQMDKADTPSNQDEFIDEFDYNNWNEDDLNKDSFEADLKDKSIVDWGDIDGESREHEIIFSTASQEKSVESYDFAYDSISVDISLPEYLNQQIQTLDLGSELLANCVYLIGCLDNRGYFDESADSLIESVPYKDFFDAALIVFRDLDPVGVGAFDLQSCLIMQLEKMMNASVSLSDKSVIQLAYKVVKDEFVKLSKHQYASIIKNLKTTETALEESLALIHTLNPAPGLIYESNTAAEVLMPDIDLFWQEDGSYKLELNQALIPTLSINQQYKQLALNRNESAESIKFLKNQVQNAKFWLYAIKQREETLLSITNVIVETQLAYLKGIGPLMPLSMQDIAQSLGIHQTTVSRSIFSKNLQTPDHIYPLKSLLSKAYQLKSGEHIPLDTILVKIKQLISKESPLSPVSDKKIAELLSQLGYDIPVRTVSHYREKLGYLPAHLRTTR